MQISSLRWSAKITNFLNIYHSLGKILNRRHFEIYFFFIFPRKHDLTFHANCLQWRQSPMETICMKHQILFSGKNKKKISKYRLLKFLPSVISINIALVNSPTLILSTYFLRTLSDGWNFPLPFCCWLGWFGFAWKKNKIKKNLQQYGNAMESMIPYYIPLNDIAFKRLSFLQLVRIWNNRLCTDLVSQIRLCTDLISQIRLCTDLISQIRLSLIWQIRSMESLDFFQIRIAFSHAYFFWQNKIT